MSDAGTPQRVKTPPTPEDHARGRRIRKLREAYGWTQQGWAERSGGLVSREMANQIESGYSKFTGTQALAGFATAFGLTLDMAKDYRDGKVTLETVLSVARVQPDEAPSPDSSPRRPRTIEERGEDMGLAAQLSHGLVSRFPRLSACLAFYENKWSKATVAAAQAGLFGPDDSMSPQEWAQALDELEHCLSEVRSRHSGRTKRLL